MKDVNDSEKNKNRISKMMKKKKKKKMEKKNFWKERKSILFSPHIVQSVRMDEKLFIMIMSC